MNKRILTGIAMLIIITIGLVSIFSGDDEKEAEEVNRVIGEFEAKVPAYLSATNNVAKDVEIYKIENADSYRIFVYFSEKDWVSLSDSEKSSVAATINRQMKELSTPSHTYVYIKSLENKDNLAEPKVSGDGMKITR